MTASSLRMRRWAWISLFCLVACGDSTQRDERGVPGQLESEQRMHNERSAVTTRVENSAAVTGSPPAEPGFRLGDAVEVGPDGKPMPPKK